MFDVSNFLCSILNLVDFHKQNLYRAETLSRKKRKESLLLAPGQYHADFTASTALKAL